MTISEHELELFERTPKRTRTSGGQEVVTLKGALFYVLGRSVEDPFIEGTSPHSIRAAVSRISAAAFFGHQPVDEATQLMTLPPDARQDFSYYPDDTTIVRTRLI